MRTEGGETIEVNARLLQSTGDYQLGIRQPSDRFSPFAGKGACKYL